MNKHTPGYDRRYYEQHGDRIRARVKTHHEANREQHLASMARRRDEHPEYERQWRVDNPDNCQPAHPACNLSKGCS